MKHIPEPHRLSAPSECERTRLAQSPYAAVDACACGTMQVHIGGVTLRLAPEVVSELVTTLGQAVARHEATRAAAKTSAAALALRTARKGEA